MKQFLTQVSLTFLLFSEAALATIPSENSTVASRHVGHSQQSLLVDDFLNALTFLANPELKDASTMSAASQLWVNGLNERGVSTQFLVKRLNKLQQAGRWENHLATHRHLPAAFAESPTFFMLQSTEQRRESGAWSLPYPIALHMTHVAVDEDYDDVMNDDLFVYSETTYQDLTWGKVSSIYTNLDEGSETLFLPADRPLFDPRGRFHALESPLILDYGIVESDSDDIEELSRLSKAIVDLAAAALVLASPDHGVTAARVRAETQNLIRMLISMDDADRLVMGSMVLDPLTVAARLGEKSYVDWQESFSGARMNSDFSYRLGFRLIRALE